MVDALANRDLPTSTTGSETVLEDDRRSLQIRVYLLFSMPCGARLAMRDALANPHLFPIPERNQAGPL